MNAEKLELLQSFDQETEIMEQSICNLYDGNTPLEILEAGCGNRWQLNLNDIQYRVTGVDTDKDALEIRKNTLNDLDTIIAGDLRKVELEPHRFDVIYNSFVLEHINGAEAVLKRFDQWIKPDGLLILRIPEKYSVWGFVARKTPFSFHVWYRRVFGKDKNAGKPGYEPYPTFYDEVVSRKGIQQFCDKYGYDLKVEYGHGFYIQGKDFVSRLTKIIAKTIYIASLGKLEYRYRNITMILKKKVA